MEEKHDVFARVQILELAENGDYLPVEVIQTTDLDKGSYQLHQGLQRRIVVDMTHSSGEALPWQDVSGLRLGRIQLVDHVGKTPDLGSPTPEIAMKLVSKPAVKQNANGTTNITVVGQWDSSAHASLLLDRVTADKYKIQMSLVWDVSSPKLASPVTFSIDLFSQILSRSYVRSTSMFASLWQSLRIVHSTSGVFSISVRPTPVKRAGDLWRMNTQNDYVKGEEGLTNWSPRGVSLIRDHIAAKRRKHRLAEIEAAQPLLNRIQFPTPSGASAPVTNGTSTPPEEETSEKTIPDRDKQLLEKYLQLWTLLPDPINRILTPSNTEPPSVAPSTSAPIPSRPSLLASLSLIPKNPTILKGGYLLTPSVDSTRWVRRFVELRRPYLYVHSVPDGEEVSVVSLRNSRVDSRPEIARLLQRSANGTPPSGGGQRGRAGERDEETVFAVYGTDNTWLFKARSEREKVEWIWRVDQSYFGSASGSGSESPQ
jgi:kinesin family protein 1